MHGKFSCFEYEGTQYIRSDGDCTDQLDVLNPLLRKCSSSITETASLRCVVFEDEDVLTIYDGGKGNPCKDVAAAINTMTGEVIFGDGVSAGTAACTL